MNERALLQAGFRYALALRSQQQDAEDLVQESWLRLFSTYGEVPHKAALFTAIRNLYIDRYRREKLIVLESLDKTDVADEIADNGWSFDAIANAQELELPLAKLREEEREALFLNVVEGYTTQEIAELTERSRNTVLSLIYRARQKLQKSLREQASANDLQIRHNQVG